MRVMVMTIPMTMTVTEFSFICSSTESYLTQILTVAKQVWVFPGTKEETLFLHLLQRLLQEAMRSENHRPVSRKEHPEQPWEPR